MYTFIPFKQLKLLCSPKGEAYSRHNLYPVYLTIQFFIMDGCLYLEKYKQDCNKTWFIDRWQWEEGQCTITIILPCTFTQLSSLSHCFIMVGCPGHILESTKEIDFFIFLIFFQRSTLSVLHGHSVFSSPPQRPMTSNFEGFLYQILSITLFSYLNS